MADGPIHGVPSFQLKGLPKRRDQYGHLQPDAPLFIIPSDQIPKNNPADDARIEYMAKAALENERQNQLAKGLVVAAPVPYHVIELPAPVDPEVEAAKEAYRTNPPVVIPPPMVTGQEEIDSILGRKAAIKAPVVQNQNAKFAEAMRKFSELTLLIADCLEEVK